MIDWNALVKGADISHYQQRPDFGRLAADGIRFVIMKATQGNGVDPDFDHNRNEAVRHNMLWAPYPFLTPSDNDATINHFCNVVGRGSKVPTALDWEKAGTSSQTVEAWMDLCEAQLGRAGLAYYGKYPPDKVTQKIGTWPHWYAQYPKNWLNGPSTPPWNGKVVPTSWVREWLLWQYTGHGRLAGISTEIDLNVLAIPLAQFKVWYDTGSWAGAVPTAPVSPPDGGEPKPSAMPDQVVFTRVLYPHCSGEDVLALQRRLQWLGETLNADGEYGPETGQAVKDFQVRHGLATDGIAGRRTVDTINSATIGS